MKTTKLTPADLQSSVIAVPPMPRNADGSMNIEENRRLLAHMRAGGITTYMYGGNANFYNVGVSELGRILDPLSELLAATDWLIPSVGADFGKASEQLALLRERAFPTAMVLPLRFPSNAAGVATGMRKLADRYGKPLIAYIKDEGHINNKDLASLVKDGVVSAIKYAVVRARPGEDTLLADLVEKAGADIVISGIGERPVIDHFRAFGLRSFTSGSGCVAPALSNRIREALLNGEDELAVATRELFLPLEDVRDAYSPIRVMHAALEAAGVAVCGPMGEFLSAIDEPGVIAEIDSAAKRLMAHNAKSMPDSTR